MKRIVPIILVLLANSGANAQTQTVADDHPQKTIEKAIPHAISRTWGGHDEYQNAQPERRLSPEPEINITDRRPDASP